MEGYMTMKEAAEALGITKGRVSHLLKAGILEGEKFGTVWAIAEESVERRKVENPGAGRPPAR